MWSGTACLQRCWPWSFSVVHFFFSFCSLLRRIIITLAAAAFFPFSAGLRLSGFNLSMSKKVKNIKWMLAIDSGMKTEAETVHIRSARNQRERLQIILSIQYNHSNSIIYSLLIVFQHILRSTPLIHTHAMHIRRIWIIYSITNKYLWFNSHPACSVTLTQLHYYLFHLGFSPVIWFSINFHHIIKLFVFICCALEWPFSLPAVE